MQKSIDTIRFLGIDMVNKAQSGHPGIVLGAAPLMYQLYTKHMKHVPNDPNWFDRDRFVLSAGHGSALLYATLHLSGYELSMDDLKAFRQVDSITPGHPEYGETPGVEATTGPLGQGLSMATGMALSEQFLRNRYNKKNFNVVDHYTYTLVGDGDLQEGVAMESMSLAGHLGLNRLIVIFDSNDVQLDGPTEESVSDDYRKKVEAMNWDYQSIEDANNLDAFDAAIEHAKASNKPSFIEVKSIIGYGASVAGTSKAHGAPIGEEEAQKMRAEFNYSYSPFDIPRDVYDDFSEKIQNNNAQQHLQWQETMEEYGEVHPKTFNELENIIHGVADVDYKKVLPDVTRGDVDATRASVGKALDALSEKVPQMIGGSADLSGSTKVKGLDGNFTSTTPHGRNINFGVREHAMAAMTNGMTLHNLKAFAGGFFIFSDYMKPSIRLSALMNIPSIFIFTHDSVAVGEDGPTHEPVEQLSVFRATPNINTIRPANASEVNQALRFALEAKSTPTAIVATRQKVTTTHALSYDEFKQGAAIVRDVKTPDGVIVASGSEVELALKAADLLKEEDINVRVVTMPSMELFDAQPKKLRDKVLPKDVKTLAVELGSPHTWYKYADDVVGLERFGKSGKGDAVVESLGFTPENVAKRFKNL